MYFIVFRLHKFCSHNDNNNGDDSDDDDDNDDDCTTGSSDDQAEGFDLDDICQRQFNINKHQ